MWNVARFTGRNYGLVCLDVADHERVASGTRSSMTMEDDTLTEDRVLLLSVDW